MAVLLDPSDCFQDSPLFRQDIELVEQSTERFSEAMKKVAVIAKKCADAERGWSPPPTSNLPYWPLPAHLLALLRS